MLDIRTSAISELPVVEIPDEAGLPLNHSSAVGVSLSDTGGLTHRRRTPVSISPDAHCRSAGDRGLRDERNLLPSFAMTGYQNGLFELLGNLELLERQPRFADLHAIA